MNCRAVRSSGIIAVVYLASFVIAGGCGAPELAQPTSWREVHRFPDEYDARDVFGRDAGAVFICGVDRTDDAAGRGTVWVWDGAEMRADYSAGPGSRFYLLSGARGSLWAVGSAPTPAGGARPLVVTNDGTGWNTVPVADYVESVNRAAALGPDVCFFSSLFSIYEYNRGSWRKVRDAPQGHYIKGLYATAGGRVFFFARPVGDYAPYVVLVSDDGGGSWAREELAVPAPFAVEDALGAALGGEDLFLAAVISTVSGGEALDYWAVLDRRDARAGAGEYAVSFYAPAGPNFYSLNALAFASWDDGVATGPMTAVRLDDGVWRQEVMPDVQPSFAAVSYGGGRYWALLPEGNGFPAALYCAPGPD